MKNYCSIVFCVLISLTAFGQPTDASVEKQEAACYARFAVNDCLRKVRAHQREARDIQRRKEIKQKDAERKEKAQQKLERFMENSPNPG